MLQPLLFTLLTVGFVFGQFLRIELGNGIAITLIDAVVGLIAVIFLLTKRKAKKEISSHPLFYPAVFFVTACTLSLLVNSVSMQLDETFVASLYLLRWASYLVLFYWAKNIQKTTLQKWLVIMGTGAVIFGYLQYFFYNSLKGMFQLGWDEHMYRMLGGFLDPNFAGAFYVLFFLFLLPRFLSLLSYRHSGLSRIRSWTSLSTLSSRPKGQDDIKINAMRYAYMLTTVATLIAIYLSYSRSAFLMLLVGITVYLFLMKQKKLLFGVLIVGIGLFVLFSDPLVESKNPFRMFSSEARITSAKEAITLISKSPLIGVGFNAYRYGQRRFGLPTDEKLYASHSEAGTDNSFLFIFATTGIIGLIVFLYLQIRILTFVRSNTGESVYLKNAKTAGLIGIFVDSVFINSLFFPMILCWLWLTIGSTGNKKP